MKSEWFRPFVVGWILSAVTVSAQVSDKQEAKSDYTQEAYVIEQMITKMKFDTEGKRTREQTTRVEVKTDAGVQAWGLLTMPYQSAVETVEVNYVRVRKSDGTTITTPEDNVQDLDAEITRSAPFYSDLREKHIAVKGLGKGDVLEYQVHWRPIKPLITGQFWVDYNFHHSGIVLDEEIEISAPADRAAKFKGPQATQAVKTEGTTRVYSWTYKNLQSPKESESDQHNEETLRGRLPRPDVQFSSFQSWEEVGRWYWGLQKDRIEPSPAVSAKAAELTKGLNDDAAKVRALYRFVSVQYRYIGIAFGIGRYQPHAADDVLGNNYGDCKDKHTLLAALLQASGIRLYPALISSVHALDPEVPSPGQFDHIIGYLPQGNGATWLDTTPEVAPPGYLVVSLRDKPALVMMADKPARLIDTPADPPFANVQNFKIEGKLHEDGTLEAHVDAVMRGDTEVVLRTAFRRVPQPQWKDLVQQISYGLGYAGTVSEVDASAPDVLGEPFHFRYAYNRKDYPDWANRQFTVPGLPFLMPPLRDDAKNSLWLGALTEMVSDSKVELPKGYKPELPSDVDLKYDFAEYHASYKQDQGVLTAHRRLKIKMAEVPVAELEDYRGFLKNLNNDVNQYVQTSSAGAPRSTNPFTANSAVTPFAEIGKLPDSSVPEANGLENDARSAVRRTDPSEAERQFQKALETDPKFTRARVELAIVYMMRSRNDEALEALRKAIETDPKALAPRRIYAYVLSSLRRDEAASQAWRDLLRLAPDDAEANSAEAALLIEEKRYADALAYLETAAKHDTSASAQIRLGAAYLKAGQTEKGSAILQKILEKDISPVALNDVAYELADANTALPQALDYAKRAVEAQERESHDLRLPSLMKEDLECTRKIGSFWDTLGWVDFRMGNLDEAESYLQSAWLLSQMAVVADHLGQLYEQEKKVDKAIYMYRLAVATPDGRVATGDEPQKHLERLGAKVATTMTQKIRSGEELSELRTIKLKNLNPHLDTKPMSAEFFLLFNSTGKVEETSFISGAEQLRSAGDILSQLKFKVTFPTGSSARIVRRGILLCSKISGCNFVLYTPNSVTSVN